MLLGAILAPGPRTVTAALRAMGLAAERHFTNDHRVLNRLVASGLTVNAAKERTAAEFRALLASAGFHLAHIVPIGGEFSVIEATTAE